MNNQALIVVDMCNDFVADDGRLTVGKPAQAIVPAIIEQCQKMLDAGGMVVFAVDNHKDGIDGDWPPHCDPTTSGINLYGGLKDWWKANTPNPKIDYLRKTKYDAFWGTPLAELLKKNGITAVTVVGVCTDICVFNTAAGAYYAGFSVSVVRDGCATLAIPDFENNVETVFRMMQQQFFAKII